jgi:hypothetical protein
MQVVTYLHSRFHEGLSGGSLARSADLESAFDTALRHVQRSISSGMKTSSGSSARPQLEKLETELKREQAKALELGIVDREWVQKTVRDVVEWVPDTDLTLVAALGRIVRAAPLPS